MFQKLRKNVNLIDAHYFFLFSFIQLKQVLLSQRQKGTKLIP